MVEIIKRLTEQFSPEIDAKLTAIESLGNLPVFEIQVQDQKVLAENWKKISNFIASIYQASLRPEQDFERWNTYVFYICPDEVDRSLRGRIENNKFSSRKIVIPNCPGPVKTEDLIAKYITGDYYLKEFTSHSENSSSASKRDRENGLPSVDLDLEALIGSEYAIDRSKKKGRETLDKLLKKLESNLKDETIQS